MLTKVNLKGWTRMSTKLTMKGRVLLGCVCVNNSQQINRTDLELAHSLYIQHQEKSNKKFIQDQIN